MDEKQNEQVNQVARKLQLIELEINTELKLNPCIVDKEAFLEHLHINITKFINEHYRD